MNKRYMDFVPKNRQPQVKKPVEKKEVEVFEEEIPVEKPVIKPVPKPVAKPAPKPAPKKEPVEEISLDDFFAVDDAPKRHQKEVDYGIIEDYSPKFVKTEIKKRPLGHPDEKFASKGKEKEKEEEKKEKKAPTCSTLSVPKARFVNTEKIEKRPLSKNVYKKKVIAPKEEPSGPVTIITKPDKGSHIGVIVTIILTIVLGAAAGTVAFLLLPK